MNIYIITQEEPFYLPMFFKRFTEAMDSEINIKGVSVYDPFNGQSSWLEVVKDYLMFYGIKVFMINGLLFLYFKFVTLLSKIVRIKKINCSVEKIFKEQNVEVNSTLNPNDKQFIEKLKCLEIDLLISVACPKILRNEILKIPGKGCINFHSGHLPKYRGMSPLFWSMLNRENHTAISIHYMNGKIDDGDIIVQEEVPIVDTDTLDCLYKKIISIGPYALVRAITLIKEGSQKRIVNDDKMSSYYGFPRGKDGRKFRELGLKFR